MDRPLEQFQKRKKRNTILRTVIAALLIVLLLTGLWIVLDRFYFLVKDVETSPSALYDANEIISALHIETGSRLFSVDKQDAARLVEESFPFLTKVKIVRKLPHTVFISFEEKMGEIALTLGQDTFAVDTDLMVLARIDQPGGRLGLTAEGVSRCIVGEKIDFFDPMIPEILSHIMTALEKAEMIGDTQSLDLQNKFDIRLEYREKFHVRLGEDKDLDLKFAMIRRVMEEFSSQDEGEIDISDPNKAYVRAYSRT